MGLFSKKRVPDVIDLTKLRDKGTLQRALEISEKEILENSNSDKVVDLTPSGVGSIQTAQTNTTSDGASSLGFLGNFAGIGASNESKLPSENMTGDKDFNALRLKIEDIEYKLDRFIERIDKIEEKLREASSSN